MQQDIASFWFSPTPVETYVERTERFPILKNFGTNFDPAPSPFVLLIILFCLFCIRCFYSGVLRALDTQVKHRLVKRCTTILYRLTIQTNLGLIVTVNVGLIVKYYRTASDVTLISFIDFYCYHVHSKNTKNYEMRPTETTRLSVGPNSILDLSLTIVHFKLF